MKRVLAFLLLVCLPAHAWLEDPHRLVGKLALLGLSPALRAWVEATMKKHPDPEFRRFDEGCVWPDWLKGHPRPQWNGSATWHYVNIPFTIDGTALPVPPTVNVLSAAKNVESELRAHHQEAEYLCFLGHLVGDIHQPLHCATRYTHPLAQGDRGGNSTAYPDPAHPKMNLHLYWDSVAEDYYTPVGDARLDALAAELRKRYPRSAFREELKRQDWSQWSEESFDLAVNVAYPFMGKPEYADLTRGICLRRIALAGYRLADRLRAVHPETH